METLSAIVPRVELRLMIVFINYIQSELLDRLWAGLTRL